MEFADKVIIVTGASSGIGRATALAFAQHGCYLTLTGRNVNNLNEVATLCKTKGAKDVVTVKADFENMSEVETVVTKTVEKFKTIHIVVNSAGFVARGTLEQVKMDDFDRLFLVNVKSMVRITQQAMPYLIKTKGNVINVSSYLAEKQFTNCLIHGMTKAAVNQFTRTTALEYGPKGVRVNAICPYAVRTAIARHTPMSEEELDEHYKNMGSLVPLGRTGDVEDCANAIMFLSSSQSSWTTGQCLVLDGGRSLV